MRRASITLGGRWGIARVRMVLVGWAACTALGAILIALPDTGPRVLSLSGEHGPGAVDSVGAVVLLLGFGVLLSEILRRRAAILENLLARPVKIAALSFLAGVGTGLMVAGVFANFSWWWLVGALLLQGFWLSLIAGRGTGAT